MIDELGLARRSAIGVDLHVEGPGRSPVPLLQSPQPPLGHGRILQPPAWPPTAAASATPPPSVPGTARASPAPSRRRSWLRARTNVSCPSGPGTSLTSTPACTSCQSLSVRYCSNCRSIALGVPTMYEPPRAAQELQVLLADHPPVHHPDAVGPAVLGLHRLDDLLDRRRIVGVAVEDLVAQRHPVRRSPPARCRPAGSPAGCPASSPAGPSDCPGTRPSKYVLVTSYSSRSYFRSNRSPSRSLRCFSIASLCGSS